MMSMENNPEKVGLLEAAIPRTTLAGENESRGMISAASRYISHQVVMSAWRRKPVVLFTILAITVLVLFVQYSQVGGDPKVPRLLDKQFKEPEVSAQRQGHPGYALNSQRAPESEHDSDHAQPIRHPSATQTSLLSKQNLPKSSLQDPQSAPPGAPLHRVVHFDLKGAPPKISYIKKILPILKEAGATGVMMEYEDMFPYTGVLEPVRAGNAYTVKELEDLLNYITVDLKLQVIPLLQTFGHMEFVLKLEKFRHLREVDEFPAVICPSKNESFALIKEMANQVMALHSKYQVRYFHIGCDEVFHLGDCNLCSNKPKDELLLGHMAHIAAYIRNNLKVIPLVWDDMMRHFSSDQMKRFQLDELVEPMVWTYVKDVYRFIPISNWLTFGETFPYIWAASASKGAFGETLTVPNAKQHLENNVAWLEVIQEQKDKFTLFRGLVITGWQRYDHFATLAETFPAGFPSLILSLLSATAGGFAGKEDLIRGQMAKLLGCQDSPRRLDLETDEYLYRAMGRCYFPGSAVFRMTENHRDTIKRANEYYDGVTIHKAWLTPYNVRRNFTFIDRIDQGLEEFPSVLYSVTSLVGQARDALREVFDEFTVAEWIEQNIYPTILKLDKLKADADSMRRARTWPKRPLPIHPDLQRFNIGRQEA